MEIKNNAVQIERLSDPRKRTPMATKILIAEDEPFIVESLDFLLSREGYAVETITDGILVCDTMLEVRPDLLILDIMLPTVNGFDILRRIRATPEISGTPVLVLTAKGQETDRVRMSDLGADEFITKPFSNKDLMTRVGRLARGHGDADRPA